MNLFLGLCERVIFIECFSFSPGNERYDLLVTPQQGNSEPIVQDLAQLVEEATGVPIPFQKLIFKGGYFSFIFEYLWLKDRFRFICLFVLFF